MIGRPNDVTRDRNRGRRLCIAGFNCTLKLSIAVRNQEPSNLLPDTHAHKKTIGGSSSALEAQGKKTQTGRHRQGPKPREEEARARVLFRLFLLLCSKGTSSAFNAVDARIQRSGHSSCGPTLAIRLRKPKQGIASSAV